MGLDDIVRINQSTFAWTSSAFLIDAQNVEGITSVDYEQKLEIEVVHAARRDGKPVAFAGNGKYSVPGFKIRMLKDTAAAVKLYLATGGIIRPGLGSYGSALWTFTIQCIEPIVGAIPISTVAAPCKVAGVREAREEGTGKLVEEWDIACLNIIENGIPLWDVVRGLL